MTLSRILSTSVFVCGVLCLFSCKDNTTGVTDDGPVQYDYSYVRNYRADFDAASFTIIREGAFSRLCMKPNTLTEAQSTDLAARVDTVIARICGYLSTSVAKEYNGFRGKVTYFIEPGIIPRCYGGSPIPIVSTSTGTTLSSMYAHETVHIFSMKTSSTYLIEGLAVHLADTLGIERLWPNYRATLHGHAKMLLDGSQATEALGYIGMVGFYSVDPTTPTGEAFYTFSGSFIRYLMQTIGKASFITAYASVDFKAALFAATHKSFDEWKAEWLACLRST